MKLIAASGHEIEVGDSGYGDLAPRGMVALRVSGPAGAAFLTEEDAVAIGNALLIQARKKSRE